MSHSSRFLLALMTPPPLLVVLEVILVDISLSLSQTRHRTVTITPAADSRHLFWAVAAAAVAVSAVTVCPIAQSAAEKAEQQIIENIECGMSSSWGEKKERERERERKWVSEEIANTSGTVSNCLFFFFFFFLSFSSPSDSCALALAQVAVADCLSPNSAWRPILELIFEPQLWSEMTVQWSEGGSNRFCPCGGSSLLIFK